MLTLNLCYGFSLLQTTYVAANFASFYKHNFQFMHCWEIMKDEPKWQEPKHGGVGEDIGHESNTIDLEDGNSGPASSAGKRPMGRDAAKAARKKANYSIGSASSSEYASRMQDLSLQKISIMEEENVRKGDRFQQLAAIEEKRYEEMQSHNKSLLDI